MEVNEDNRNAVLFSGKMVHFTALCLQYNTKRYFLQQMNFFPCLLQSGMTYLELGKSNTSLMLLSGLGGAVVRYSELHSEGHCYADLPVRLPISSRKANCKYGLIGTKKGVCSET